MTRFASAKHLASWAGVCPGHHESAGRTKNTKGRPGNPYLKGALGLAAFGAVIPSAATTRRPTRTRGERPVQQIADGLKTAFDPDLWGSDHVGGIVVV